MDERERTRIIEEWQESVKATILTLYEWERRLDAWKRNPAYQVSDDEFMDFYRPLVEAGLDGWADGNPCGGGLDVLRAAVCGEELPQPPDLLTAIFGGVCVVCNGSGLERVFDSEHVVSCSGCGGGIGQ